MWNNNETTDNINYQSITFKSILSTSNLISVKNNNSGVDFNIKNTGEINFTNDSEINFSDLLKVNKNNDKVNVNNLVINTIQELPGNAVQGQLVVKDNKLHIHLDTNWEMINSTRTVTS